MPQSERGRHSAGYALALGAAACVGLTPVASKILLRELHVVTFGAVWFGCAGSFAVLTLLARGRGPTLLLRGRTFLAAAGVGVSNALAGLLYFRAVQIADPALVGFFTRPGTILIVLSGVLVFRERLRAVEWLAVAIVIGGGMLMGARASAVELQAFLFVILSTVLTSVSYSLAKGAVTSVGPLVLVAYRGVFTSLVFGIIALALGETAVPVGRYLWAMPIGAFVGPFFSFVLLFASFHRLPMSRATVVHSANPLFTAVYGRLIVGSRLTSSQLAGGLLATLGIALLVAQKPASAPPLPTADEGER